MSVGGWLVSSGEAGAEEEGGTLTFDDLKQRTESLAKKEQALDTSEKMAARAGAGDGIANYGGGKTIYDFSVSARRL